MQSQVTKIFLYHQSHRVILLDTSSGCYNNRSYNSVFSKDLVAHKATDNRILINFVNQQQKRVNLNGIEFIFRLISGDGTKLYLEKMIEVVNIAGGQGRVVLTESELDKIPTGKVGYSIERHYFDEVPYIEPYDPSTDPNNPDDGASIQPVYPPECLINGPNGPIDPRNEDLFEIPEYEGTYVDDNAGGRGTMNIVDSIMPEFVSSKVLTIPSHSTNENFASSIINTEDVYLHTFQITPIAFTGTITFQGGTSTDNMWYDISSGTYTSTSEVIYENISGFHPFVRISVEGNTDGEIGKIIYR